LEELSYNFDESTNIIYEHPHAIYASRLLNFPNLPEPTNCPDQQEFVSSSRIIQVQTGEFYHLHAVYLFVQLMNKLIIYFFSIKFIIGEVKTLCSDECLGCAFTN
jgi:hypothetical protein